MIENEAVKGYGSTEKGVPVALFNTFRIGED